MNLAFGTQFKLLLRQHLRAELASKERLVSPLLFAATILLLFWFALGDVSEENITKVFVAETYLAAFFALQISFSRIFEPEMQDNAFDLLRTYPVSPTAWFLAKYVGVVTMGVLVLLPTMIMAAYFHETSTNLISTELLLVALLALLGLCSLGVLICAMTLRAGTRQILYPLLYFPLTTPVLLAAVNVSLAYLNQDMSWSDLLQSWLGLLIAFDVVYLTLGILLFGELIVQD